MHFNHSRSAEVIEGVGRLLPCLGEEHLLRARDADLPARFALTALSVVLAALRAGVGGVFLGGAAERRDEGGGAVGKGAVALVSVRAVGVVAAGVRGKMREGDESARSRHPSMRYHTEQLQLTWGTGRRILQ